MPEETATTPAVAPESSGLAPAAGQASSTPADANNLAVATPATPSGQAAAPASTPKYRFKDQSEAERAHSELQSRYSRIGDPDQAAQGLGLLGALQQDPEFLDWAKARIAKHETGSGDPETVKAIELVKSLARQEATQMVAPLAAQAARGHMEAVVAHMEKTHPGWQDYATRMGELLQQGKQLGFISPQANPLLNYTMLESLYRWATGGDKGFAAKAYKAELEQKQATSTQSSPGLPVGATAPMPAKGLEGALRAAMKQHGVG
jgi:hypothetical protein